MSIGRIPAVADTITHAEDTTNVHGIADTANLVTLAGTQTLTNKTLTSPTMTAPVLGTPASGTLTNCTGLPVSTGVSGLGTGIATALSVNSGSAGAPVLIGGALGTPSSATLTNATGLPISGITSSTTAALGVGSIELGHASDTTIARSGPGVVTIEGSSIVTTTSTDTLTNKTITSPRIDYAVVRGLEEDVNIVASAATGTINFDVLTASVWYYTTAASADFTLNLRGDSGSTLNSILAVGDSLTAVFLNTNGATARRPTVFQIDGSSVTPLWQGGTAPTSGNASSTDAYTLTVIKTAAAPTYVVLASQTQYK